MCKETGSFPHECGLLLLRLFMESSISWNKIIFDIDCLWQSKQSSTDSNNDKNKLLNKMTPDIFHKQLTSTYLKTILLSMNHGNCVQYTAVRNIFHLYLPSFQSSFIFIPDYGWVQTCIDVWHAGVKQNTTTEMMCIHRVCQLLRVIACFIKPRPLFIVFPLMKVICSWQFFGVQNFVLFLRNHMDESKSNCKSSY